MGWRINLVKNELPISDAAAADILALDSDDFGRDGHPDIEDGKLVFHPRHLEWMDYVWRDELLDILLKHKATGEILFSSSEGDNANTGWGYRFEDGVLTNLVRDADRQYVPNTGQTIEEAGPTGNSPERVEDAKIGDRLALAVHMFGMTSYEEAIVGDILPDGTIVSEGREFKAPTWTFKGDDTFGPTTFTILPVSAPGVDLEDA